MSSINYEKLLNEMPELSTAFENIDTWLNGHSKIRVIDPRRILKESEGVSVSDMAEALSALVKCGQFKQFYAVQIPSGALLDDDSLLFETPTEVPSHLNDQWHGEVLRDDAIIVPVLRKEQ